MKTFDGKTGEVTAVSVLRQKVKLKVAQEDDTFEIEEYKVDELRFRPKKKAVKKVAAMVRRAAMMARPTKS